MSRSHLIWPTAKQLKIVGSGKQPNQVGEGNPIRQVGVSPPPNIYFIHYGPSLSSPVLTPPPRARRLVATRRGQSLCILCASHICGPPYHLHSKSTFLPHEERESLAYDINFPILSIHDVLYRVLCTLSVLNYKTC